MNHSPRPRSLFRRTNSRRLQQRIPTAFGGGGRKSNSAPQNVTSTARQDGSGSFERCMPRAVPVRDTLMQPTGAEPPRFGGKIVEVQVIHDGHAYSSPLRAREYDDYSHSSSRRAATTNTTTTTTTSRDAIREDYSYSSPRRGRVNPTEDDYHYMYQDSIVEAMPPPMASQRQPNLRGITNSRSNYSHDRSSISSGSRRNRGHYVYEQEDSIIEPMPTMARPTLKAPPTPSCHPVEAYQDALARKMAAFEKPVAKKKQAAAALPLATTPVPTHLLEIAPGVTARLRGAQETMNCIANDFYLPTTCFACETNLFCIMDADYVLCPLCKVVSPVSENGDTDGGIGLGFTFDDLQHYTADILRERGG